MYTLHEVFLPQDMQDAMLANFDDIQRNPVANRHLRGPREWFAEQVSKQGKTIGPNIVLPESFKGYDGSKGSSVNGDIHIERLRRPNCRKFFMSVANRNRLGIIFVEGSDPGLMGMKSDQLFRRAWGGRLALKDNLDVRPSWAQAANGQLSSFNTEDQQHCAPPIFEGDERITLSAIVDYDRD